MASEKCNTAVNLNTILGALVMMSCLLEKHPVDGGRDLDLIPVLGNSLGRRGGGEGTKAMNSCVKGAMEWLPS